jgi:hypothetical protein
MNYYYDFPPLLRKAEQLQVPLIAIAGGKGNGKTYSIIKYFLKEGYFKHDRVLRYLRRYVDSITPKSIKSLCDPHLQDLVNLSNGKYNSWKYFQHRFYPCRREHGKIVETAEKPFIICTALNGVESSTGADEGDCCAVFYDEFLSREKELADEFYNLMIFHNNCVRNRTDHYTPLILVGNTVTRNSILARDIGINLYEMKQGEITVVKNKKGEPTCICEYCASTAQQQAAGETFYSRFDNDRIKMIYKGDWTVSNYPRIQTARYLPTAKRKFTFLIIAPNNTNIHAVIYKYKKWLFMYVTRNDTEEKHNVILTNAITPLNGKLFNYFNRNIKMFKIFAHLIATNQTYFECAETGEYFRDFLKNFNGGTDLAARYE